MTIKHPIRRRCSRSSFLALMFGCYLLGSYSASVVLAATDKADALDAMQGTTESFVTEESALNETSANTVLIAVLDVITGHIYNDQFFEMHRFTDTIVPTSTDYILQTEQDSYQSKMYDCPEGGNADITQRMEENGKFENTKYAFVDCNWNDYIINGITTDFKTNFGEFRNHFDELSLIDAEGQQSTLSGFVSRTIVTDYGSASPVGMYIIRYKDTVLAIKDATDTLSLDVTQTSLSSGIFCPRFVNCYESASFSATFTLRAKQMTDGHELQVSTPQTFVNDNGLELRFDRGALSVVADDGSTMTVEADNGNPSTLTVTTVTADNISTSNELLWSDLLKYLERSR